MTVPISPSALHRTAKLFMDDGSAATAQEAMARLQGMGLTICVGPDVAFSIAAQTALFSLVNTTHRTFLGGIDVVGIPDAASLVLMPGMTIAEAVMALGGRPTNSIRNDWPLALIGHASVTSHGLPSWQLTWEGWRGGVIPARENRHLSEDTHMALAPLIAAAACANEVFSFHAGDGSLAGRRATGLSLWNPGADWMAVDDAPAISWLPSRLWIIGLGNLGQALCWTLAALPYPADADVSFVLQDNDIMATSNESTSLLATPATTGQRKTRVVAEWLEARGFATALEERWFGSWTRRNPEEPAVAFCGVDNALARSQLEDAGFDLIVEAGLGSGPQAFRSLSLHTFPASRLAVEVWKSANLTKEKAVLPDTPAYAALKAEGMDECGLTTLAERTVGVPFVGLTAACLAMSELLRRLHDGPAFEVVAGSLMSLDDMVAVPISAASYAFGHIQVSPQT